MIDLRTITMLNQILKQLVEDYDFSENEIAYEIIMQNLEEKRIIVKDQIKELIEKEKETFCSKHHTINFVKDVGSSWIMIIKAEKMEMILLLEILNNGLFNLKNEKSSRVIANKNLIQETITELINIEHSTKKIAFRIWYSKKVYYARIHVNGAKLTFQNSDVPELQQELQEALPPFIRVMEKSAKK